MIKKGIQWVGDRHLSMVSINPFSLFKCMTLLTWRGEVCSVYSFIWMAFWPGFTGTMQQKWHFGISKSDFEKSCSFYLGILEPSFLGHGEASYMEKSQVVSLVISTCKCQVKDQHHLPVIWGGPLGCLAHLMTPVSCFIWLYYAYEKHKQEPLSWAQFIS